MQTLILVIIFILFKNCKTIIILEKVFAPNGDYSDQTTSNKFEGSGKLKGLLFTTDNTSTGYAVIIDDSFTKIITKEECIRQQSNESESIPLLCKDMDELRIVWNKSNTTSLQNYHVTLKPCRS